MKRALSLFVVALVMAALLATAGRSEPQQPNDVDEFMRLKLQHSQKVLEGLAVEDFDMIAKHAQEISLLSQASTWQVLQTPEYNQQSLEFRRAADAITEAAKKKELEAAALSYVGMTMKCISCHKYVRGTRISSLDRQLQ